MTTVLSGFLLRDAVYPSVVREAVAEEYLSRRSTYQEIATAIGCGKNTPGWATWAMKSGPGPAGALRESWHRRHFRAEGLCRECIR